MKTKIFRKESVGVITLGCSKNLVDSENIATQVAANGFHVQHEPEEFPDIAIINTCGFIDLAKEESINTILQYVEYKKDALVDKVYVTGCLSERYKEDLRVQIPEVDAYFGTMELPALMAKLNADYKHELIGERKILTPQHYAYLKISEGCNRTCSFCAIPLMRGGHRSRAIEELVLEAKNLARNGVKELILIAQELTYYGLDIYRKRALPELLNALCEIDGVEWIRLHYAYPSKFPMEIINVMKDQDKVCNYLDIPLQHSSDRMLGLMKRQITNDETKQLISDIRRINPAIAIRTTFLVGFPGETDEDFEHLCDFVQQMQFERLGVFQYSHEEDTSAHQYVDDVPQEVKEHRAARLMELQREISFQKNKNLVGREFKVLIDRIENGYFVGRTEFDSPEVDNEILISTELDYLRMGDFAQIRIISAEDYDLFGVKV